MNETVITHSRVTFGLTRLYYLSVQVKVIDRLGQTGLGWVGSGQVRLGGSGGLVSAKRSYVSSVLFSSVQVRLGWGFYSYAELPIRYHMFFFCKSLYSSRSSPSAPQIPQHPHRSPGLLGVMTIAYNIHISWIPLLKLF